MDLKLESKPVRPLLSLVMIIKDEASSIRELLEAAKPHVDRWTILDTGSEDGTQDIVREVMKDVPGALYEEPFVDFSHARNRVIERDARGFVGAVFKDGFRSEKLTVDGTEVQPFTTVFNLMLSGDEYLRDGEKLREHLEQHRESDVDCHFVRVMIDGVTLHRPIVLRTGSDWCYEGVVHEVPFNRVNPKAVSAAVDGAYVDHIVSDPERRLNNIWETHIPLLEAQVVKDPTDARALIFLAQSYDRFLSLMEGDERRDYARKSVELYTRRLLLPVETKEERDYVQMRCLDAMRLTNDYTDPQLFEMADKLCEQDPGRPETALLRACLAQTVCPLPKLYDLAHHAATVAAEAANAVSTSPVDLSCCWRAHHLAAVVAKQIAKTIPEFADRSIAHIKAGLAAGGPPNVFRRVDDAVVDAATGDPV